MQPSNINVKCKTKSATADSENRVSCSDSQLILDNWISLKKNLTFLLKNVNVKYKLGVCTG